VGELIFAKRLRHTFCEIKFTCWLGVRYNSVSFKEGTSTGAPSW